jgi:hypothetical protein
VGDGRDWTIGAQDNKSGRRDCRATSSRDLRDKPSFTAAARTRVGSRRTLLRFTLSRYPRQSPKKLADPDCASRPLLTAVRSNCDRGRHLEFCLGTTLVDPDNRKASSQPVEASLLHLRPGTFEPIIGTARLVLRVMLVPMTSESRIRSSIGPVRPRIIGRGDANVERRVFSHVETLVQWGQKILFRPGLKNHQRGTLTIECTA